jgi:hypothetical protein
MVFSRTTGICPAALALMLAAIFWAGPACGQSGGGAAPAGAGSTLHDIKEELFGPSRPYGSGSTADRLMNPMPAGASPNIPRVPDAQSRQSQQREREWIFSDLNDLNSPPTLESLAGMPNFGPDGRDKNKMPPIERYFEELELRRGAGSNSLNGVMTLMMNQSAFSSSNSLNSLMYLSPGMNSLMGDLGGGSNTAGADSRDLGGAYSGNTPTAETSALLDQKRRLEDFKRLLTFDSAGSAPSGSGPANTFGRFSDLLNFGAPSVPAGVSGAAPAVPTVHPVSSSSALGTPNPAGPGYHSSMNEAPATTFAIPGATRLTTLPPPPPPPKAVSLDPFKDNSPKRSF